MAICDGGTYRPQPARRGRAAGAAPGWKATRCRTPDQPDWVRLNDVQEWVAPHLIEAYGAMPKACKIAALETPPPVDLRVNRLKATVAEARAALADEGIDTEPMRFSPDGLRLEGAASRSSPARLSRKVWSRSRNEGLAARGGTCRCKARHADRRLLRRRRRHEPWRSPPA